MKRMVCLILTAVLLLGLMSVSASAEGTVKLVVTGGEAAPGETVEVLLSIENNPSISGISGEIKFDETVLTYVDFTAKTNKGVWSMDTFAEDHMIMWYYDGLTNAYTGSELIALTFQVAEDAAPGEYPVTIQLDPDWDAIVDEGNNTLEDFEIVAGTVTVTGSEEPTEPLKLVVTGGEAAPGETVEVLLSIENNPSISGISGEIKFDETVLTYVDFTAKTNKGVWSMDTFAEDHMIMWYYDGMTNAYTGSELIALTFKVAEGAEPGEYPVTIQLDPDWDAIVDEDNAIIEDFEIVPGVVTVKGPEVIADGYYLVGTLNEWTPAAEYKFEPNPENGEEFLLEIGLVTGNEIKVVYVENGVIKTWYPNSAPNYVVDDAHSGMKTIYFYPWYAEAWSAFGGYIWIDAALTLSAEVYGTSVSLKGDIGLNFYLILPEELTSDADAYVMLNDTKCMISETKDKVVGDFTVRQFAIALHAKQMNDEVALKVFTGEGQQVTLYKHSTLEEVPETGYVYSVQAYIQKTLETSSDEKLNALVQAMSDYGSLAQVQFNYNTDNCAEVKGDLDSVTADSVTKYQKKVTNGAAEGVSFYAGSLVLRSQTAIKLYFLPDEGAELESFTFKQGTKTLTATEAEVKIDGETKTAWVVEIPNIAAKDLDKTYTVKVTSEAGTVVTVKYSGLSYVYDVLTGEGNPESLINLVKGIYLYNQAANAYFA